MAELGLKPGQSGCRERCEGDNGSVTRQAAAQGFSVRRVRCFTGQIPPSFPVQKGLTGINPWLATERAEAVAGEERE